MAISGLYKSAHSSLYRICTIFANDMRTANIADLKIYNFDAGADEQQWSEGDLIGLCEYQVMNSKSIFECEVMFTISTENDTSLDRLDTLISNLFDRLPIDTRFPFVDSGTGVQIGHLVVKDDVRVMPVARVRTRPIKFIGVAFGSDRPV